MPEQGPDWFLVATEACGGGTPDLLCSSMFLGYMDIYRRKKSVRGATRGPRGLGHALPPGRAPLSREHPGGPPTYPLHPYIPTYPKTSRTEPRSGVPPPQASRATKNQSGPLSDTLPEGGSLSDGHLHHPGALHDEEGVVLPRG